MSISTYLELKTAIQNWSKRSDTLSVIDDFIDLAESDIAVNLKVRSMEGTATGSTGTTDRYLALPTGFLSMRKFRIYTGGASFEIEYRAPESMNIQTAAGRPRFFTVTNQVEFDRVPDSAYSYEMAHFKSLTALSSSNTTNDILTRFPAIYLYGSLFHFAQWAHDDAMIQKYSLLFDEAMKRANKLDRRGRHGPAPAMHIEGSTP
jgi:hypothetical protein|tara:strand:+ start:105 stop:719 length:615 start_codon:yes stop_codon:yes gene_type:complete